MIDMKVEKKDVQEDLPGPDDFNGYPYGLRITICDEKIDDLGLDKLKVGDKTKVYAEAECVGFSENVYDGDRKDRRCELQIQMMEVKTAQEDEDEEKETFFSSSR